MTIEVSSDHKWIRITVYGNHSAEDRTIEIPIGEWSFKLVNAKVYEHEPVA